MGLILIFKIMKSVFMTLRMHMCTVCTRYINDLRRTLLTACVYSDFDADELRKFPYSFANFFSLNGFASPLQSRQVCTLRLPITYNIDPFNAVTNMKRFKHSTLSMLTNRVQMA